MTQLFAVGCPEFSDNLLRRDPLALGNLLTAFANRGLEAKPILGIELISVVILLDELEANLGAFRKIDDILDDDSTTLNATMKQRHAFEDTTMAAKSPRSPSCEARHHHPGSHENPCPRPLV
jgi:hypothetical protein